MRGARKPLRGAPIRRGVHTIATIGPVNPIGPAAAITALAPLLPQGASPPSAGPLLRVQLAGVALTTFVDGRADAVLARAANGPGFTLTFAATGQKLSIAADAASQFIAPGTDLAVLQFELVGESASGSLIAKATLLPPLTTSTIAATAAAMQAAAGELASISSTARQMDTLARLAPTDAAAWISMRGQLAETAHLHTAQATQAAVLQGFLSLLPSLGLGYERALAKAVLAGADPSAESLSRFPQVRVIPAADAASSPDRSGGASAFDESGIAAWSAQQLSAHEQGSVHWCGTAWPGAEARIDVGLWRPQQTGTEDVQRELHNVLPADMRPGAWLRMSISPPALGPLDIYAVQVPGHGAWARIKTSKAATLQELARLQTSFADALGAARVRVDLQLSDLDAAEGRAR